MVNKTLTAASAGGEASHAKKPGMRPGFSEEVRRSGEGSPRLQILVRAELVVQAGADDGELGLA
ncbi:hypothetical protein, partial [Methylobacterium sp. R2-1]|uniref:hypothetical protein n=1 Tax=Methylobacterium sp. R2-1 TaxID=2587064 RepID=UPI001AEF1F0B